MRRLCASPNRPHLFVVAAPLVATGAFVVGLEALLLLVSLSDLLHPATRRSNNAPRIKFFLFIAFPFLVAGASAFPRCAILSPSPPDKDMPAIAHLVMVRHPGRAKEWRAIPMTSFPNPTARWTPDPSTPDPDKTGAGHGSFNVHFHGRWRRSAGNHHLSAWRSHVDVATGCAKPHCHRQHYRFQHSNFHI